MKYHCSSLGLQLHHPVPSHNRDDTHDTAIGQQRSKEAKVNDIRIVIVTKSGYEL